MYDKELYDIIFNIKAIDDNIIKKYHDYGNIKYDENGSFDKYYDVNLILTIIKKYETREISIEYFLWWLAHYLIILVFCNNDAYDFKTAMQYLIVDTLDALSFFDKSNGMNELELYKKGFVDFDYLYKISDNCDVYYVVDKEYDYGIMDVFFLIISKNKKEYCMVDSELSTVDNTISSREITIEEYKKKIKTLKYKKYKKLKNTWQGRFRAIVAHDID